MTTLNASSSTTTQHSAWSKPSTRAGVAVVPQAAARRHARALRIRPVPLADGWARRSLVLCMQDLAALPPFTRRLVEHLRTDS